MISSRWRYATFLNGDGRVVRCVYQFTKCINHSLFIETPWLSTYQRFSYSMESCHLASGYKELNSNWLSNNNFSQRTRSNALKRNLSGLKIMGTQLKALLPVLLLWILCCLSYVEATPTKYQHLIVPGVFRNVFARSQWTAEGRNTPKNLDNIYNDLTIWSEIGSNRSQCQSSVLHFASDLMDGKPYTKKGTGCHPYMYCSCVSQ